MPGWRTATLAQCPQEGLQVVAAQVPQPPAEVLPARPPKTDIIRFVFFDLHFGQITLRFSPMEKKSSSKTWLHFVQRNS